MTKTVCVVGAGLSGGIVAATLAANGHAVTLLELGDSPLPLKPEDELWEEAQVRVPFTRGQGIGGSSNFWHGGLTMLDRSDVEGADGMRRQACLPISYEELHGYYAKAVELLRADGALSLSDIESPSDSSTSAFPTDAAVFRYKTLLYPDRPFSTAPMIRRAQSMNGMKVVTGARVTRFGGIRPHRVDWAECIDPATGVSSRVTADKFVLCAGGLGSPRVLLDSAKDLGAVGRLPVGRHIIDHPTGFMFKAKLRRRMKLPELFGVAAAGGMRRYGFTLAPDRLAEADGRNHILYLRPAMSLKDPRSYETLKNRLVAHRGRRLAVADVVGIARQADLLFDAVNFRFGLFSSTRYVSGFVFAEQWPDAESRIRTLADSRYAIRWRVSQDDATSLAKFLRLFREAHAQAFERFELYPDASARLDSGGHHSGGCRMGATAEEGVVDKDLRVFGVDNLHVADGSVLGSTGHANTGLTIAAMALKCCDAITRS